MPKLISKDFVPDMKMNDGELLNPRGGQNDGFESENLKKKKEEF